MQWENIISSELENITSRVGGVCIIPVGSIEPHGKHLPLGTDYFVAHKVACLAAEQEEAVVFPPMYLGSLYESKALAGAIALKPDVLLALYDNLLSEIERNGFKKIIIFNGHGGNNPFLKFLGFSRLSERHGYNLYISSVTDFTPAQAAERQKDCEGRAWGHACEFETSMALELFEELVKLKNIPNGHVNYLDRRSELQGNCFCEIDWYSTAPDCYVGDASFASKERGRKYVDYSVSNLVSIIKKVKGDTVTRELTEEFYDKSNM